MVVTGIIVMVVTGIIVIVVISIVIVVISIVIVVIIVGFLLLFYNSIRHGCRSLERAER